MTNKVGYPKMIKTTFRRVFLFLLSVSLLAGGGYLLSLQLGCLFGWMQECSVRGFGLMVAGSLTALGGALIWDEFIRRWLSRQD